MLTRSKSPEATLSLNESESINGSPHILSAAERLAQLDEQIILETIRIRESELVERHLTYITTTTITIT